MVARASTFGLLGVIAFGANACVTYTPTDDDPIDLGSPSATKSPEAPTRYADKPAWFAARVDSTTPAPAPTPPKACDGVSFSTSGFPAVADQEFGARWDFSRTRVYSTRRLQTGEQRLYVGSGIGQNDMSSVALNGLAGNVGNLEYPTLSEDGESLFFGAQEGTDWQIFVAKKDGNGFGQATPFAAINGTKQDIHPYVTGNALYWAQGDEPQRSINRYDLVTKTTQKNVLNLVAKLWNPVVTRDELTIYFSWNRDGVDLPSIIHIATRKSTSEPFGPPISVDALPKGSGITWVSDDRCEILFETRENDRRVVRRAKSS